MFEDPTNIRLKNNAVFYKDILSDNAMNGVVEPELKNARPSDDYRASEEFVTYERLCRGEETMVSGYVCKLLEESGSQEGRVRFYHHTVVLF